MARYLWTITRTPTFGTASHSRWTGGNAPAAGALVVARRRFLRNRLAVVGLVVGRPDPAEYPEVKPRLGQDVVLHREQYGSGAQDAEDEGVAAYEDAIAQFYRSQGLPDSWSERVLGRFAAPGALGHREGLRQALLQRGFGFE